MYIRRISLMFVATLALASCSTYTPTSDKTTIDKRQTVSLAQAYSDYFDIGAALNRDITTLKDRKSGAIVQQHFNSVTAENDMKWEQIQPSEGEFTFDAADALVNFAAANNKKLIGHVLVWHQQTPNWVFEDKNGKPASRELLLSRMKTHIFKYAARYKNDVQGWDVVNEALNEDGTMRDSKWHQIIGDDFIDKAFEYASQAAPGVQLYYNDYNMFKPKKMDAAIAIAKRLKQKGIRIDGIGLQGHYGFPVPVAELETSIKKVAAIGLQAMITELDITVLKFPDPENMGADISMNFALQEAYNPYTSGISTEAQNMLAEAYSDLFKMFVKNHQHIARVTLWGVTDNHTWRNNWPMNGRTDYPLLFDRNFKAKPFVAELINIAQTH